MIAKVFVSFKIQGIEMQLIRTPPIQGDICDLIYSCFQGLETVI